MTLSPRDRTWLALTAVLGLLGPNGVFLYFLAFRRQDFIEGLFHPVAMAFVAEVLLLTVFLAVCISRRSSGRVTWRAFVVLSLAGGLLCSIPTYMLLESRGRET
ncbi:MAG: hypothetical protein ABIP66_16060 [Gemmatimonadaceae bacterium]